MDEAKTDDIYECQQGDTYKSLIKIARLRRKIDRLQKQKKFFEQQVEHFKEVLNSVPHITRTYNSYTEAVKERERVKALEQRCKEQELLIKHLSNNTIRSHEIKAAYDQIIKQEYKKQQLE